MHLIYLVLVVRMIWYLSPFPQYVVMLSLLIVLKTRKYYYIKAATGYITIVHVSSQVGKVMHAPIHNVYTMMYICV